MISEAAAPLEKKETSEQKSGDECVSFDLEG